MSEFNENPHEATRSSQWEQTGESASDPPEPAAQPDFEPETETGSTMFFYSDPGPLPGEPVFLQYLSTAADQPLQVIKGIEHPEHSQAVIPGRALEPQTPTGGLTFVADTAESHQAQEEAQFETGSPESSVIFVEPFGYLDWPS